MKTDIPNPHILLSSLKPYTHVHFISLGTFSLYSSCSRSFSTGHELELELLDFNSSEQRSDRKSVEVLKHWPSKLTMLGSRLFQWIWFMNIILCVGICLQHKANSNLSFCHQDSSMHWESSLVELALNKWDYPNSKLAHESLSFTFTQECLLFAFTHKCLPFPSLGIPTDQTVKYKEMDIKYEEITNDMKHD